MPTVTANGVRLYYDEFGDASDPHVILIPGGSGIAEGWLPDYYQPIVDAGYHVVRIDNRDIGRSTFIDYEKDPYTLADMASDLLGLMDVLGIERAHLVGTSMGGMIAQVVALRCPERVISLTSQCSTPGFTDPTLPPIATDIVKVGGAVMPDDPEARTNIRLELFRALSGSRYPFDEADARKRIAFEIELGSNPANSHAPAVLASPSRLEELPNLTVPTLVIHGTEDPLIPYAHAEAMAKAVPGAKLHPMDGVGHQMPRQVMPEVTALVIEHIRHAENA